MFLLTVDSRSTRLSTEVDVALSFFVISRHYTWRAHDKIKNKKRARDRQRFPQQPPPGSPWVTSQKKKKQPLTTSQKKKKQEGSSGNLPKIAMGELQKKGGKKRGHPVTSEDEVAMSGLPKEKKNREVAHGDLGGGRATFDLGGRHG